MAPGPQTSFPSSGVSISASTKRRRSGRVRLGVVLPLVALLLCGLALIGPPSHVGLGPPHYREQKAELDLRSLASSLDQLRSDIGRYPTATEGLALLIKLPEDEAARRRWHGPYLRGNRLPRDPWNQPYHYSPTGKPPGPFALYSDGPPGNPPGQVIGFPPPD
jgi:general secretion pathway protein G